MNETSLLTVVSVGSAPLLTVKVISVPLATVVPLAMDWPMTCPAGALLWTYFI